MIRHTMTVTDVCHFGHRAVLGKQICLTARAVGVLASSTYYYYSTRELILILSTHGG